MFSEEIAPPAPRGDQVQNRGSGVDDASPAELLETPAEFLVLAEHEVACVESAQLLHSGPAHEAVAGRQVVAVLKRYLVGLHHDRPRFSVGADRLQRHEPFAAVGREYLATDRGHVVVAARDLDHGGQA